MKNYGVIGLLDQQLGGGSIVIVFSNRDVTVFWEATCCI